MECPVPEPFRTALSEGRAQDVCDAPARTPEAHYGRALARMQVGRDAEARIDLEVAEEELADFCLIERVLLKIRERSDFRKAAEMGRQVLRRAPEGSALKARAHHIVGLAEIKLFNPDEATRALVEATGIYRDLNDRCGIARVQDTLGSLHASQGRIDLALCSYALSLSEKAVCGDRYGMAITLGNLARTHLRLGRYRNALDFLEQNHLLTAGIGDERGRARALEDMGCALLGLEEFQEAEKKLEECLQVALAEGYRDLQFYAYKDLARVHMRIGELDRAERDLALAETIFAGENEPYVHLLLETTRGELLLAQGNERALEVLEKAAREHEQVKVPDLQIPLLMTLARAYVNRKLKRQAEVCLERALEEARGDGYERFLRPIREEMVKIGSMEGLHEEKDRLPDRGSPQTFPGGYVLLKWLGKGRFGDVYRAYDPQRDQIVALKRLDLETVYNVREREFLWTSAKLEIEAASRIRHPGVARVFAIGEDSSGGVYIVQEFVKGRKLRDLMREVVLEDTRLILRKLGLIANALDALHRQGVVHRDLKPENIMLRAPTDLPVLVDFGVASIADFKGGFDRSVFVGTLNYAAPEQRRGEEITPKVDLFSLGAVAYEWLTGGLPEFFSFRDFDLSSESVLEMVLSPLHENPRVSPALRGLIERLLSPYPENRLDAARVAELCHELATPSEADRNADLGSTHCVLGSSTDTIDPNLGDVL